MGATLNASHDQVACPANAASRQAETKTALCWLEQTEIAPSVKVFR
mgnify:CR=1 FL=1